jgi:hypothetical protein
MSKVISTPDTEIGLLSAILLTQKKPTPLETQIELWIKFALSRQDRTIFSSLLDKFQTHFESSASSVQELKKKTTKAKGGVFEVFSKMYLKAKGYPIVYLLSEVPTELLANLGLRSHDTGIDLIAIDSNGKYSAVQAKYRLGSRYRANTLSWKTLSTFYATCSKSGPYVKHIVITNCVGIRNIGDRTEKDQTIAFQTLNNTDRAFWLKMIGSEGYKLGDGTETKETINSIANIENKEIINQQNNIVEPQIPETQEPLKPKLNIIPEGQRVVINNAPTATARELRAKYFMNKLK